MSEMLGEHIGLNAKGLHIYDRATGASTQISPRTNISTLSWAPEGCYPESAPDINDDGRDELVLNVGGGSAHADSVAFYVVGDEAIERIDLLPPGAIEHNISPGFIEFQNAGSASMPSGIFCRDEGGITTLVYFHASSLPPTYKKMSVTEDIFAFDGTDLRFLEREHRTARGRIGPSYRNFCGYRVIAY